MRIKIHGGTVQNGQSSLCHTCRHATVVRGARLRDEIVECAVLGYRHNRVTFRVTSCSDYVSRQHPSLREMEETAWILRDRREAPSCGIRALEGFEAEGPIRP